MTPVFGQDRLDTLADEVLTLIEMEESRLLGWGFMRVQSNLMESIPKMCTKLSPLGQSLWEDSLAAGFAIEDILSSLARRKLVFESKGLYRSRFAEAVRLLFLLRQLMPHMPWEEAPRLVSDLRLHLQRRRYPRRDVPISQLTEMLKLDDTDDIELAVIKRLLLASDGTPLNLAQFQAEATAQQLRALHGRGDRGFVIGAGTGAGKTKAFYIPALAYITSLLSTAPWTKALAIYPRVELLKDQLAEAFSEIRKLDDMLSGAGKPKVVIGAYYGDTPISAEWLIKSGSSDKKSRAQSTWKMTASKDGWIFPSMICPHCSGDLIWDRHDVQVEAAKNKSGSYGIGTRLVCRSCNYTIAAGMIALTRKEMIAQPPDILFTTTEMLNRRLSRTEEHALFGIGTARPPRLMLLDEIHTYEGMSGAQVAYLLRRWQYARRRHTMRGLVIVGLSATLTQAEQFFARLTGISLERIHYITPTAEDLVEEGVAYNIVLKGDPVSGTSLLSTSVQTAMLLARILDPMKKMGELAISDGVYGQKIFAFTDTLDVINRWYHIEQDAETRTVLSKHRMAPNTLNKQQKQRRNDAGQWWWACEQIGHDLEAPLSLDLTSSQYRGVRSDARLVIATSTLEVGFNDPTVGAVIQHKAPRSMASFLQRKGRAGRTRGMRPWMVVVTSAYGRDRWAFQHAENLFSPILPPLELPLENIYVQKMQAAYAMMDWLAAESADSDRVIDVWSALSSDERHRSLPLQAQREWIARLLKDVLAGGAALDRFEEYLKVSLGLSEKLDTLNAILWAEPRSLIMEIIPTLLRQIETCWQRVEGGIATEWGDTISDSPMPDFVTPNLFSLLSLPELTLHIPDKNDPAAPMRDDEQMALTHGMSEYAPGHVSKRYARSHLLKEAHWLSLPDDEHIVESHLQLSDLSIEHDLSARRILIDGVEIPVYRPRAYTLSILPTTVLPTSSARLLWRSQFNPQSRGESLEVPSASLALAPDSPWRSAFSHISVFTQAVGSWVEVTRAAIGVRVETRYTRGSERRRQLYFADGDSAAALGFSLCVDGLCVQIPPCNVQAILESAHWPMLRQHLMPAYALHHLECDARIVALLLSDFEIEWLWQLELSMLVAVAVTRHISLEEASIEVIRNRPSLAERAMDVIFQSQRIEESDDLDRAGRLRERLQALIADTRVTEALDMAAATLWEQPSAGFTSWLRECYTSSLGHALFDALTRLIPDINPDDLTMDLEGDSTIWIAEQAAGGVGIIQRIADTIRLRPRDLDLQLIDSLAHCDREALAKQLLSVAHLIKQGNPDLTDAFMAARQSADLEGQGQALEMLRSVLEPHGMIATRELIVALNAKFLRPNSDVDTDSLIATLADRWSEEQYRLGCTIDLRVMAVAAGKIDEIQEQVRQVLMRIGGKGETLEESQIFNLLQSLLWLDCSDSCPDCIEYVRPYQKSAKPSRALIRSIFSFAIDAIHYGENEWIDMVVRRLVERFSAQLLCRHEDMPQMCQRLGDLLTTPLEVGFQQHYATIERVEQMQDKWLISLVIRDLVQS